MTRLPLQILASLGHGSRDYALYSSRLWCNALDSAASAVDSACSTSAASRPSAAMARRYATHRPNLLQAVDTNHIDALLSSSTVLQHALIPVLQYGNLFDPEQVTRTLQRVPRMLRYQLRKRSHGSGRAAAAGAGTTLAQAAGAQKAREAASLLLDALGSRLAAVAPDCSDEQLARAIWAYGVSRHHHPDVLRAACEQLQQRLGTMPVPHVATAAWGLAAAARDAPAELAAPVRQLLQAIGSHLVATQPDNLELPAPPAQLQPPAASDAGSTEGGAAAAAASGGPLQSAADEVAAAAGRGRAEGALPWLDHRSAVKLAWAFATAEVRDPQVLDLLGDAAASRIATQLRAHNPAAGPLSPRATFLYRTVRGWQAWPRPRPPRTGTAGRRSRYLYDERPRVVLRDFTLSTLAPLLCSFRRLGHIHEGLLQASAQHVLASTAGASLRVRTVDVSRLTAAYSAARFRHGPALEALLLSTQLHAVPAPLLARLATLAAEWGVRRRSLYDRLLRQLTARAWVAGGGGAASAALALAGAGGEEDAAVAEAAEALGLALPDTRAVESGRATEVSWRATEQRVAAEAAAWGQALQRPEDECQPGELARLLQSLAKAGFKDPQHEFVRPLFAAVLPHLADRSQLPPDLLCGLALAAAAYNLRSLDGAHALAANADVLADITNLVLYGERRPSSKASQARRERLLHASGRGDGTLAASLRADIGISPRGAARLADALGRRPQALPSNDDLRAALALVEPAGTSSGKWLERLRNRLAFHSRTPALPKRLALESESLMS
ncbi:hypothetical protein GPECTOR_40g604 [Gonium pectorale]|uniref:Uncharacterized protein n=1 Tax=Gonium pectorale TaxID=33097 RepID=A0A150GBY5_GONPE|nr:hypothetical protein GPECTOR_40g604 [Gonium pectorale]|eukprot:KXZ46870.1 hypothetical protein GPECTOR_40g604 [Gonium pectorale]